MLVVFLTSALVSVLMHLRLQAPKAGADTAAFIGAEIKRFVPPSLRPFVIAELKAMGGNTALSAASVTGVAAAILAKTSTAFPTVIKDDIILVLADYVSALDSGLVNLS